MLRPIINPLRAGAVCNFHYTSIMYEIYPRCSRKGITRMGEIYYWLFACRPSLLDAALTKKSAKAV